MNATTSTTISDLATIAPSLFIQTHWTPDDLSDIRTDVDGMDDVDPADWQSWVAEVRVTVIQGDEEVSGSAYLGGIWAESGSTPSVHAYEDDLLIQALEALAEKVSDTEIRAELLKAAEYLIR